MKNILLIIGALVIIGGGVYMLKSSPSETENKMEEKNTEETTEAATAVTPGTYTVDPEASEFEWAGKKPFIDGYTNSGTIAVSEGEITVSETDASGTFTLDMNTLHVGLTAKKPGQEGTLEGHLKGERWFDVATYPTATFVITDVATTSESDTTHTYTVTGDLTMKGSTHEITFPARIYQTEDGLLHAEAETEIDRTLWGITSGSGNFFEDLGDNLIANEVALSFSLVANPKE